MCITEKQNFTNCHYIFLDILMIDKKFCFFYEQDMVFNGSMQVLGTCGPGPSPGILNYSRLIESKLSSIKREDMRSSRIALLRWV